jgi:glycosyltransferase involved in cell wall biosynthesis
MRIRGTGSITKIVFLPKYSAKSPSSRYRIYQYLQFYEKEFKIRIYPLLGDSYFDYLYGKKVNKLFLVLYVLFSYIKRALLILFAQQNTIFYVGGGEFFPYFFSLFEKYLKFRRIPFVLDFDDAIFHNYDDNKNSIIRLLLNKKIPKAIAAASYIVTGSPYLTSYASQFNRNVIEIPTSIDINKYTVKDVSSRKKFQIGWIGSKTTSKNILGIVPALKKVMSEIDCEIVLIGFDAGLHLDIDCKVKQWNEDWEVEDIKQFDVGIMPLDDTLFNRGKCGFKLIQYMACGLSTISTPLEANIKIDQGNGNLFASTNCEWYDKFVYIYNNKELFSEVGRLNRETVKKHYSIQSNCQKYIDLIYSLDK